MREARAEKDDLQMTNAATDDRAASGAEQGAHVALEKASSKKGAIQRSAGLIGSSIGAARGQT